MMLRVGNLVVKGGDLSSKAIKKTLTIKKIVYIEHCTIYIRCCKISRSDSHI